MILAASASTHCPFSKTKFPAVEIFAPVSAWDNKKNFSPILELS